MSSHIDFTIQYCKTNKHIFININIKTASRFFYDHCEFITASLFILFALSIIGRGKNFNHLFCIFLDWDLNVCLKYECKRKGISYANYLKSWIDLKKTYKVCNGKDPFLGLRDNGYFRSWASRFDP